MHAPLPKLSAAMSTERPRSRRERRREAARRPVLHVVMPGLEVARAEPRKGETITAFLRRVKWASRDRKYGWQFKKGLPTILEVNGEPLLRRHWSRRRIRACDNLRFVSSPLGGGQQGKQIMGLVALVAIAAFAGPLGGMVAANLGFTAGTTAFTVASGLATAAIGLGGSLLVNALVSPKAGATNAPDFTTDQIYTVQAQGNVAKLGQPLPVRYGREKVYPDFAATPWGEFVGNDQYLNVLLSMGMGSFSYEQLFISDTPFWDPVHGVAAAFSSAQIAFYEPGAPVTLFPLNVSQSDEVTGQQLPHGSGLWSDGSTPGAWIGPFVANAAGTQAYQLAIDFVFPAGCFQTDDKGNTQGLTVHLTAERQEVDDAGAPIGDWITVASLPRTYGSRSPIRDTFLVGCPEGRWQVRFRRDDGVPADNKGASDVVWAGLRAYLRGNNSFPDVSTIAIRIKATETTQGSYKFGVLSTRKLPVWDAGSSSMVTQATRNPLWAFLDSVTNTQYGSGHPASKADFNTIVNAAAAADARGDHFDCSFTSAVSCPEAWDKILTPARSRHFWLGDTISVVRDEWRDVPAMLLTDREIVRDSTQISWTMLGEDDPDAVVIEYIDENTWLPASVQYPPETEIFTATNPETKRIDGIVNRDHAYRECAFYYLQSIYRRENVQIGVEYEGRAITYGSVLRVQSELPQAYGYGGAVMESAGTGGRTLTLSPAPTWTGDDTFIRLRRPNGKWFGPVAVTKGADDAHAVLDATDLSDVETQQGTTLAAVLLREDGAEYPSFELGTADNQSRLCVVLSGQPNGNLCTLNLVVDDERVHATDLGDPPVLPVAQFPADSQTPLIAGLTAQWVSDVLEPKLGASWFPAAGAFYYRAEVSYDDGTSWIQVYEGVDNKFTTVVARSALTLRVQAIGPLPGPYSEVALEAPTIQLADKIVGYNSFTDTIKDYYQKLEDRFSDNDKRVARLATTVTQALARTQINKVILKSDISAANERAAAGIEDVRTVAVSAEDAVAALETTVSAQFDALNAAVTEQAEAIATIDGYAATKWSVLADVGGNVAGIVLFNDSDLKSNFTVTAATFQVASPGDSGGAAVPVFTVSNVGGTPKLVWRGDMVGDGSIITQMIAAGAITAVTIQAGAINTTQLAVNSVDINKLIAGAATKTDFSTHSSATVTFTNPTLVTRTVDIRSGSATITHSSYMAGSLTGRSSRPQSILTFYVDGAAVRTFTWNWQSLGGTNWELVNPFTIQHTQTGLSGGTHTFSIILSGDGTVGDGEVYITDLRR